MRLLIADSLHPFAIEELRHLGVEVVYEPEIDSDSLPGALQNVGILVVRSKRVSEEAIAASSALNLIVRAGHGTGNIDVAAASARGIYVASCSGKNAIAVAELTMGLVLALDRRTPDAVAALREGRWEKGNFARADGLHGKAIGILGLGAVGREVLVRARGFGLQAHGWSRALYAHRARELGLIPAASPEELAAKVDILTVHLAANERTRGIVSREVLEALPPGAILVNTARSELVDWDALLEVAPRKKLRVGLDVYPDFPHVATAHFSPPGFESGVLWYGTPHIGAQTAQAQTAIAAETVRIVRSFLVEGSVPNVANVRAASRARFQIVVRHLDKIGSLANVLNVIKRHGINVEELTNNVFEGSAAACTRLNVVSRPTEACLAEIAAFKDEVLHVDLVALPILA
jgi:D-3-phosphoglycerate dehydrogenase